MGEVVALAVALAFLGVLELIEQRAERDVEAWASGAIDVTASDAND